MVFHSRWDEVANSASPSGRLVFYVPISRGQFLLLEILQITLSAEPFLAAVGVPRGGWCRADCASRVPVLAPGLESPLADYEIRTRGSPSFGEHGHLPRTRAR